MSPRKIQCRIVSHSNVTWSRSDWGNPIHQSKEIGWVSDNLFITSCFSSSVILVHFMISLIVLPQPLQMLVEVFKEQFLVHGLIDMDTTYELSPVLLIFNLHDAIPHAMRRQTRNQISTPMMTLIGSVFQVSKPICAKW